MRYAAVAVTLLVVLVFSVPAAGQLYEPWHRPGEQPLGFRPSEIKISGAPIEYSYTLYLFGSRDVMSASGIVKMQVSGGDENTYALGVAVRLTGTKGFPEPIAERLAGASAEVLFLIDSRTHEVLTFEPEDALEPKAVFTSGFGDYLAFREFLAWIGWIEPGVKFALRNKQQLSFGEVRDAETGSRFIRMWMEKQNTASFAPTKLPQIEVTLIPHWPVIRTLWVVWDKPVDLPPPLGKRLPALSLKLRQ